MKKSIVIVLVVLAVVVLVSPAIVGRLAETSMDENLNWAAHEAGGVRVTSQEFRRGWFSSEGQHRVELEDGPLLSLVEASGIWGRDDLPALLINTKLDHGPIAVTSMARENGSLAPGLGSAVSTLQLEGPDGESIPLPGTIYSQISLGGELRSHFVLEAGEYGRDDGAASWEEMNINVTTDAVSGHVEFDGSTGPLSVGDDAERLEIASLRFAGDQAPTPYGFETGDVSFTLADMSVTRGGVPGTEIQSISLEASSGLDGDRLGGDATLAFRMRGIPNVGDVAVDMDMRFAGADAASLGRIRAELDSASTNTPDAGTFFGLIEPDLKRIFATGFELEFERVDVMLPQGPVKASLKFVFRENDPAAFDWITLLLSTEASIDVSIPALLVEAMTQANPQAAMVIASGYLVRNGNAYEMKAELKKGLATINGAPIPIPIGSM